MQLKSLREKAGITQTQLSQLLNVGQATISQWETGESSPRLDKLPKLATALNCTIDELLSEPPKTA